MTRKTNSFGRFWKELKRRKVVHVITVYAAAAFVILALVSMVAQLLKLPEWTEAFVIILLCIGFVIAVFVSWIYDITPAGVRKTKPASSVKHIDQTTAQTSSGWKIATYISGAIIVALVTFNLISRRNINADISKFEKSIAVLPFINDSPSDSNQYFINGIMEEILNNLQAIKDFRVLSRTSTSQFEGTNRPTIPEIAEILGVNYILEGSGQKYGNNFILRVQLILANSEKHLWAKSFNKNILQTTDIISVQSEIANQIAVELKTNLTSEEKQIIEKIPTTNLIALTFYQKGRDEYQKLGSDNEKETLMRSENLYHEALKYDPKFAKAYLGLAQIYWNKYYWETYFSKEFLDSVLILTNTALSYDDKLSDAYVLKGSYYYLTGKIELAEIELDKAIQLNPNDWMPYYYKAYLYGFDDLVNVLENSLKAASLYNGSQLPQILTAVFWALMNSGFNEESKYYSREILKLDNDSAKFYIHLSGIESILGNYDKELEFLTKAYKIDSNKVVDGFGHILGKLVNCYTNLGKFNIALDYYKKYNKTQYAQKNTNVWASHRIGYLYFMNGNTNEANYFFKKQIDYSSDEIKLGRMRSEQFFTYYDLAGVYAFLGQTKKAYENLHIFNQKKIIHQWMVKLIKTDPLFDTIRNEPEFQQIVRDVETKYQAEHERVRKWLEENNMLLIFII